MKLSIVCYIPLLIATFLSEKLNAEQISTNGTSGFGYELLLAKMDYLEYKFLEMQVELKEQGEDSKRAILEQTSDILEQQKAFANKDSIMKSIFELRPRKHPSDNSKLIDFLVKSARNESGMQEGPPRIRSCVSEPSKKSGKYLLELDAFTSFEVYCEQDLHDGGWLVFQNRFNGSVNFYRNWNDYREGFGSLDGEFWLGLEKIHELTLRQDLKLLVILEDYKGNKKYALYDKFAIGGEDNQYILKSLAEYKGTAGDSLKRHKGQKFFTQDKDNTHGCAKDRKGAWWYENCADSNLNGAYINSNAPSSMSWFVFSNEWQGLKVSRMMVKY